jgi:hypothetical protein
LFELIKNPGDKYELINAIAEPTIPDSQLLTPKKQTTYKARQNFFICHKILPLYGFLLI